MSKLKDYLTEISAKRLKDYIGAASQDKSLNAYKIGYDQGEEGALAKPRERRSKERMKAMKDADQRHRNRSLGIQRAAASLAAKAGMKESSHDYDEDAVSKLKDYLEEGPYQTMVRGREKQAWYKYRKTGKVHDWMKKYHQLYDNGESEERLKKMIKNKGKYLGFDESSHDYNKSAVDKQKKINGVGEEEGRMIDRLLKGRTPDKQSHADWKREQEELRRKKFGPKEPKKSGRDLTRKSPVEESTEKNISLQEAYAEYFTRMADNRKRSKIL